MDLQNHSHRRMNPLTGEWLLVSPHRAKRPWQGKVEPPQRQEMPPYDPECYLCPGNTRAGGEKNPTYEGTYSFTNDFSALVQDIPDGSVNQHGLLVAESEKGICRVICFSPRHDLTLARMDQTSVEAVVSVWTDEFEALADDPTISYVQIFENRGAVMGCSNPHPHGQIWANGTVPMIPSIESERQLLYKDEKGSCLLCDYLGIEMNSGERIVLTNNSFVALVPFWAVWPYETMILPRFHVGALSDIDGRMQKDLASIIRLLTIKYDNLFKTSFPYSMGIHQRPVDDSEYTSWHMHMHFYPPLLRSASVKKFMVGYEMLAMPQRDITAEQSAETLRSLPETHFTERS